MSDWYNVKLSIGGAKLESIEFPSFDHRAELPAHPFVVKPFTLPVKVKRRSAAGRLLWRELKPKWRQKHRVGVHCARSFEERWRLESRRWIDRHDRWSIMVDQSRDGVRPLDHAMSQRPAERARRHWGGERRRIHRRATWQPRGKRTRHEPGCSLARIPINLSSCGCWE